MDSVENGQVHAVDIYLLHVSKTYSTFIHVHVCTGV